MYIWICPVCETQLELRKRVTVTKRRCPHCNEPITTQAIDECAAAREKFFVEVRSKVNRACAKLALAMFGIVVLARGVYVFAILELNIVAAISALIFLLIVAKRAYFYWQLLVNLRYGTLTSGDQRRLKRLLGNSESKYLWQNQPSKN